MNNINFKLNCFKRFFQTSFTKSAFQTNFSKRARWGITAFFVSTVTLAYASSERTTSKSFRPKITLTAPPISDKCTNLYVWRHGETGSNIRQVLSGGGDTEAALTEQGHKQALELANKIAKRGLVLKTTYSSDLQRALQTAAPISAEIVLAPQLREILHGRYELTPAEERNKKASLLVKRELENFELSHESIAEAIKAGSLDKFHFWKIHPITERRVSDDCTVIDVSQYFKEKRQEPETCFELYLRAHTELIRIAEEGVKLGLKDIGISTHGAVLSSLINVAQFGDKDLFIPLFYQSKEFQSQGMVIMPVGSKVHNCALAHFRYWHKSKELQFCGFIE